MRGQVAMSAELEAASNALCNNQVPDAWQRAAYPSLKPLASWVANFRRRVDVLADWLYTGQPAAFWLPGLFFPQGFLTAVLQNHARMSRTPIDRLAFCFDVLPRAADGAAAPAGGHGSRDSKDLPGSVTSGVIVTGLHLEGAGWDERTCALAPPRPRQMTAPLPPVHFRPEEVPAGGCTAGDSDGGMYACPLYKTSVRAGVLSTTGQSTNFVMHVQLPCAAGTDASTYVLSGVAALCALDGDE
uniref:Dynein heavy chain C-terminal domain-containing protein n=2 Tax=Chlamydomonas euryale TaxID=1486919 RepID=A0A7R9YUZ1_9CHLO|mmetsp:Transcript_28788/g.85151  ORF Transcript_28788/g.85151 Transcript_28788/m.85151 type:complete len:243 (+) Transcript_28788:999-1727(+)